MSTLEFNHLLVSQSDFLRGFALGFTRNGADADDLVHDTMVKALRYKNNFKEGTNMKGWLYTIMRNIFINNYKRKKFQNTVLDSTENQYFINASQDYTVDTVTTEINQSDILGAIHDLKPDFRKPFTMFLDGYHYDEIAEEMGLPKGALGLEMIRRYRNSAQKAIEVSINIFSADRTNYQFTLKRTRKVSDT